MLADYLVHLLNGPGREHALASTGGLGAPAPEPQGRQSNAEFLLPPLAEQERIVAAIEEAFSKLDAGEAGLRTVRQLLKRMRDAILAAAVTGRLVPQDPTDIPATKLLADLGIESIEATAGAELPAGWVQTKVRDIASVGSGTTIQARAPRLLGGRHGSLR